MTRGFKVGDWVTLKKPPKQIKTLLFCKAYMVHPPTPQGARRIYLEDEKGKIRSFLAAAFEFPDPGEWS